MSISINGNHLYIVPREMQHGAYCNFIYYKDNNSEKVNKIDDNKILVLDGKDYDNYERAVDMTIRAVDVASHDAFLKGYAEKAVKVDLSKCWKNTHFNQ